MTRHSYCTFHLDGLLMGLDVAHVHEVTRYQPLTRVPLASRDIRGLLNLRGQIVMAIDLRRRLGFSDRPFGVPSINVIVDTKAGPVSLLVDESGDVIEISDNDFDKPPETLAASLRSVVRGVHQLPDQLLLVLGFEQLIDFPLEGLPMSESGKETSYRVCM